MPKRREGLELVELDPTSTDVVVGKCIVPGPGLRIGLTFGATFLHFSPAGARRVARGFETEFAKANGLDWIAVALREAADELDAARKAGLN